MDVIEELIATGKVPEGDFGISHIEFFDRIRGELTDEGSELSRKVAAAQRRQNLAWSEMGYQVFGAENPKYY